MTLTRPKAVFTKKMLIFIKMVHLIHMKMLQINVEYQITMKTRIFFIGILPVFQKKRVICNDIYNAWNSVYQKNCFFPKWSIRFT